MLFADKIRSLREEKKMLQRELAAALSVDTPMYSRLERGERPIKREQIKILADILCTDESELLKLWLADQVSALLNGEEDIINDVLDIAKSGMGNMGKMKKEIKFIDLFAGIGGFHYAIESIGGECVFASEWDKNARITYEANFKGRSPWLFQIDEDGNMPYFNGDINDADPNLIPDFDVLCGGFPCQAFSMRGKRGGFEDTRGTLFREFARIVIECQPKVFIFENVKGMLSHDRGRTWSVIKQTFEEDCGYQVYYQLLNGKNYGVPQSRDRIFCIGFRQETDFKYPAPVELKKTLYDYLESTIDEKYFLKEKGVRFVTAAINHEKSYTQINGDIQLCQKRNQQFNWHGDFVFHPILKSDDSGCQDDNTLFDVSFCGTEYFTEKNLENYAIRRIDSRHFMMEQSDKINYRKGRFRKLMPRECLSLMGFDKDFKIVVPDTAVYKQAGNSIIVDVFMALIKQMDITKYGE